MTQGERVKEARKVLGLTLEKFGERVGVGKTAISNIENGNRNVTEQMAKAICREFNVDYFWLTEGSGEMFVDKDIDTQFMDLIDKAMSGENEFIRGVFKAFAKFGDAEWEMLEKFVRDVYENGISVQENKKSEE